MKGEILMDIMIRNIRENSVQKLDKIAKQKGMSRQQFLQGCIETLAEVESIEESESRYKDLINQTIVIMKENTKVLNQIKNELGLED
jgi:hypothetical protein